MIRRGTRSVCNGRVLLRRRGSALVLIHSYSVALPTPPLPHNGPLTLPHIQLALIPRVLGEGQGSQDIDGRIRFSRKDHHPVQAPGELSLPHTPCLPLNNSARSEKSSLPSQVSFPCRHLLTCRHRGRRSHRAR